MIKYYFKVAFRNISRNRFFSLINIIGLGIGLASCILICEYLSNEWSYDKFHAGYENIYRIKHEIQKEGILVESATTFSKVGPILKQDYPAVEMVCRMHRVSSGVAVQTVQKEENTFWEDNLMGVDSNFFDLFNFPFVYGSPQTALKAKNSIVLTESIAQKYFGATNPVGQEIIIDGAYGFWGAQGYDDRNTYLVGGVLKDLPPNTHLDFDFLISLNLYSNLERELSNWGDSFYTYFKLSDPSQLEAIADGLPAIVDQYLPNQGVVLSWQKMQQIHLSSDLVNEISRNGNKKATWLLALVAFILLLIAGVNYINFATAKAINRQKEIGIRKIFGGHQSHLFKQMLIESFVLNVFSLILAIAFILAAHLFILDFLGFNLVNKLTEPRFLLIVIGILLAGTLISGLYPALYVARFKPDGVINGKVNTSFSQGRSRKFLLVFQFAISILVIGCATILYKQMDFMRHKDLGISIDKTLVINGPSINLGNDSIYEARLYNFKVEALRQNDIKNISLANFIPGREIRGEASGYVRRLGQSEEQAKSYSFTQIDFDFIPNFSLNTIAGRAFDQSYETDRSSIMINKEACRLLGFESEEAAIGEKIMYRMNSTPTIIGVVDNFHQYSLQRNFQPIIFEVRKNPDTYCYLKFPAAKELTSLETLRSLWGKIFPGNPFNYFFLDDFYAEQYTLESRFMKVFGIFSFLAIFVATMGFFGLTYYTAANRIREIGVRKILGAQFWDIYRVLFKGLTLFVLLSALISLPATYYIAENWLSSYAFRIDITWWMLFAPVLLLIMIAVGVVTMLSIQSYRLNPATALREN